MAKNDVKIYLLKSPNVFFVIQTFIREGNKIISEYKKVEDDDTFSTVYNKELAWIEVLESFLKKNLTKEDFKRFKKGCKEEGIWVKANNNSVKVDTKVRIHNLNKKIEVLKDLTKHIINENDL